MIKSAFILRWEEVRTQVPKTRIEEKTMKNLMRSITLPAVVAILQLSFAATAGAQNDVAKEMYISAATVPTNMAAIHTYPEPPSNFSPLTARNEELAAYGFPARPDKQANPDHYALWERAMTAAKNRWKGELKTLRIDTPNGFGHALEPAEDQRSAAVTAVIGPKQAYNMQASGVLLNNGLTHWSSTNSFTDIWSVITVPVVQLPFASPFCADQFYYSQSLVGIDGYINTSRRTNHPLFQPEEFVGVQESVNCLLGPESALYQAFFGWENNWYFAFYLNPGDQFYTEVHAFGGCNSGSAFIEDLTTLTYNAFTIPNPCRIRQNGQTANWIVYRPPYSQDPGVIDGESPLANTLQISFEGADVLNTSGAAFYPGSQAASTVIMTMRDDNNTQPIELVNVGNSGYQGLHSLWFQTTGCAFAGGCNP